MVFKCCLIQSVLSSLFISRLQVMPCFNIIIIFLWTVIAHRIIVYHIYLISFFSSDASGVVTSPSLLFIISPYSSFLPSILLILRCSNQWWLFNLCWISSWWVFFTPFLLPSLLPSPLSFILLNPFDYLINSCSNSFLTFYLVSILPITSSIPFLLNALYLSLTSSLTS